MHTSEKYYSFNTKSNIKTKYLKIISVCITMSLFKIIYAQPKEIRVEFIGNCGLYLTDSNLNIYIDFPYKSGAFNYMEYDYSKLDNVKDNSIFIFTHTHADHYSGSNLRKVLKLKKGQKYGRWNIGELQSLTDATSSFSIQVFETKHRFAMRHYSYLINWHGKKIFISGDTESADTVLKVSDIDWAFVPAWIIHDANSKNKTIDAKMIGIYHLYPNEKVINHRPEVIKPLDKQGEIISIPIN